MSLFNIPGDVSILNAAFKARCRLRHSILAGERCPRSLGNGLYSLRSNPAVRESLLSNQSLRGSNRVSGLAIWKSQFGEQSLACKMPLKSSNNQKFWLQRRAKLPLSNEHVVVIFPNRTCRTETALVGRGGRTRTSEWRNQNPANSCASSTPILKNYQNSTDCPLMG